MESTNASWKKNTVLFLVSQAITLFGSSIVQFALVWFVTRETGSGAWVSALSVCAFAPQFLISFFAGVWADRYPRKRLIILSDGAIAIATLALALYAPYVANEPAILWAILVTSAIRSLGTGIQLPAVNALLPQFVPEEHLMRYNGFNATVQSAVQFAAPAAAGAILTLGTLSQTLLIDVATAAIGISVLGVIVIPAANAAMPATQSMWKELRLGFRYTFSDKFLGSLLVMFGAFIFLCVPAGFLATLFVRRSYGDSYLYMTIVEVVGFLGMAAGGLLLGAWGGFRNRMRTLLVGMVAFGLLAIAMGAIDNFTVYLVLMAIYGVALTMVQTATTTLIQEKAQSDMQGRVFGFLNAVYSGSLPVGMVVFGLLADHISLRLLMIVSGVLLAAAAILLRFRREFFKAGMPTRQRDAE